MTLNFLFNNYQTITTKKIPLLFIIWGPEIYLGGFCLIILFIIAVAHFRPKTLFNHKFYTYRLLDYAFVALLIVVILYLTLLLWVLCASRIPFVSSANLNVYTLVMKILVLVTALFIFKNSKIYIIQHFRPYMEYSFFIIITVLFLVMLISSKSLMLVFICIIGFSLNLYILLMHDSPHRKSLEASVKYFYLSALSTGLIANGLVVAYIWLSWNQFWTIALVLSRNIHYLQSNKSLFVIMLCSIIFGFLFKLAAFPCHLWAPEIYEGSPDPITAFLILPVKIATLAIFIKLLCVTFKDAYFIWSPLIWLSSACSMIWGCLGAYNEEKIKKFLAYTSINQMGFLFLGIICCTNQSIRATIIYLVIYIIMNWGFLQIYLSTTNVLTSKSIRYFTELKYFAQYNWSISVGFILILFSMAGIPPLAGFFGKYFLFLTTFQAEYIGLVCIGMLTSLISTFYYLRVMKILLFDELRVHRMNINSLKLINGMPLMYKIVFSTTVLFLALYLLVNRIIFNLAHEMLTACLILS